MVAGKLTVVASGALLAWFLYVRRTDVLDKVVAQLPTFRRILERRYYVDEAYDLTIVRPTVAISDRVLYRAVDAGLIDRGLVDGTARAVRALAANGLKYAHSGMAQSYIFLMIVGTVALVGYLLR